ncbi:hypothetical protein BV25DRAFT_1822532 [Artomyces pyxidatus]|uniref:Uncharacterized protein n=1 Tax=Artomyces pyxidatus TaxID=48021 RepID=A0ACB8T8M2_9AGAM|nr:hypothetical protein BV25DRAFT_1822532 [Artomyces pyxidatus]
MFGLITSALSTAALCVGSARACLPSAQLRQLDNILDKTENFFLEPCERGLRTDPSVRVAKADQSLAGYSARSSLRDFRHGR